MKTTTEGFANFANSGDDEKTQKTERENGSRVGGENRGAEPQYEGPITERQLVKMIRERADKHFQRKNCSGEAFKEWLSGLQAKNGISEKDLRRLVAMVMEQKQRDEEQAKDPFSI